MEASRRQQHPASPSQSGPEEAAAAPSPPSLPVRLSLPSELHARVERAWRLLAEGPEEHRGSSDMADFVRSADLSARLLASLAPLLDTEGGLRPGLGLGEMLQPVVLFIKAQNTTIPGSPVLDAEVLRLLREVVQAAAAALVAQAPARPWYRLLQAKVHMALGGYHTAVRVYHETLRLATEQKAHYFASRAAYMLAWLALTGRSAEGLSAHWSPAGVRSLLEASLREIWLCKPWHREVVADTSELIQQRLTEVAAAVAAAPAAATQLPVTARPQIQQSIAYLPLRSCDGCGRPAMVLHACSGCRRAEYCDKRCQVEHWRAGHRRECKQLAVQAQGTG
ncbi:hypothetical protein ABPG75_012348 [Micractinium tetrahymenae]